MGITYVPPQGGGSGEGLTPEQAALLASAVQPSTSPLLTSIELGHASDTTLSRLAAGSLGVEGYPALVTDYADLGDVTNVSLACVTGRRVIRRARVTTGGGVLTITPAGAGEYTEALFLLTSDADGTKEMGIAVSDAQTPKWLGFSLELKPFTGWTIFLHVVSAGGIIHLSANYSKAL